VSKKEDEKEHNVPGWGYSVGLYHTFHHPEVVIFGLPHDLTHRVINAVGEDVRAGKIYKSGHEYPEILEGVLCTFRTVEKVWYRLLLGSATRFYKSDEFPVLQCIWPDKQQNYPWSPNFRSDWLWAQPLLFHADEDAANVKAILRSVLK
jgi:hypothetical protein